MDHDATRPGFFPSESTLDYWKKFLTTLLLILATPYMLRLLFRNPGKAAAISSAV
jgi:hypothetical protein